MQQFSIFNIFNTLLHLYLKYILISVKFISNDSSIESHN